MSKEDSHIVPKTYIAQFTNANGRLLKIKKDIIKFPKTSNELYPSAVCYKDNFYRFENPLFIQRHDIDNPSFVEKNSFKSYENRLGKILDKIVKRQPFLSDDDAFTLIFAFLSMKQRNNVVRKGITKDKINNLFDEQISIFSQDSYFKIEVSEAFNLSSVEIIETIEKMRSQWADDSNTSKDLHNSYLLDSHSKDDSFLANLASYLMQFPWFIFESKSNDIVITSDNPGFCIDDEKLYNTKFDSIFEFIYPLDSNDFLMISNRFKDKPLKDLKILNYRFINSALVHKLNRCTFALSDEEVYACSRLTLYSTWMDYKQFISHTS